MRRELRASAAQSKNPQYSFVHCHSTRSMVNFAGDPRRPPALPSFPHKPNHHRYWCRSPRATSILDPAGVTPSISTGESSQVVEAQRTVGFDVKKMLQQTSDAARVTPFSSEQVLDLALGNIQVGSDRQNRFGFVAFEPSHTGLDQLIQVISRHLGLQPKINEQCSCCQGTI